MLYLFDNVPLNRLPWWRSKDEEDSDERGGIEARRDHGAGKAGGLKLANAAEMLGIGYRQAKRIWGQYRKRGPDGLQHGNAGRRSKPDNGGRC